MKLISARDFANKSEGCHSHSCRKLPIPYAGKLAESLAGSRNGSSGLYQPGHDIN